MVEWSKDRTLIIVRERALREVADAYNSAADMVPCECCGTWCYPEFHHRKYRSRGGDWRPSNILALAPYCHHAVTVCGNGWARDLGLAVSQWANPEDVPVQPWYANGRRVLLDNDGGYTMVDNAA